MSDDFHNPEQVIAKRLEKLVWSGDVVSRVVGKMEIPWRSWITVVGIALAAMVNAIEASKVTHEIQSKYMC